MKHLIASLTLLTIMSSPVSAQETNRCAPRAVVIAKLTDGFGETLRSIGLASGGIVETYASSESGTWSVVETNTSGVSCLVAAGDSFEQVTQPKEGEKL